MKLQNFRVFCVKKRKRIPDGEENYIFFLIWFTKNAKTSSYIGSQFLLLTKFQNLLGEGKIVFYIQYCGWEYTQYIDKINNYDLK